MNDVLAQTHTSRMGTDGNSKLGSHQQNGKDLTYTSEADGVNLADVDSFGLEKLLKDHPVVCMFAGRDANPIRLEGLSDGRMAEDIIRSSRFLDEPRKWILERTCGSSVHPIPRLDLSQAAGVLNRLVHLPYLVRIDHQHCTRRSSILSLQLWAIRITRPPVLGEVLRVVDNGSDEFSSSEVRLKVASDFHLEVAETFCDGFFC